jgi:hypothetical protein
MTEIGFKIKDYASMNTAAMWTQMNIFQNKDRLPAINGKSNDNHLDEDGL